jgi:hypothetical protein
VAGALVAGLVVAPLTTAAASVGVGFYQVGAASAGSQSSVRVAQASRPEADVGRQSRLARKVKVAKNLQILQRYAGTNNIGNAGLSVAAGPKHVMQVGSDRARVINKRTGSVVYTKQLGQLFGISGFDSVDEGTVVYDPLARRWVIAAVTTAGTDVGLVLRMSKGNQPTKWQPAVLFASAATTDSNADSAESRPAIGTSSDKVFLTTLQDDPSTPSNVNRIFFFPKTPLMNGNAPSPWVADLNSTYDGQRPAVNASKQANAFIAVPDTDDVTVTTYTGAAKSKAPNFSKNVVYPTRGSLTAPPVIDQGSGDDLDLGPLQFSGVSWRAGRLFAAASTNCSGAACVRLVGVSTEGGVSLIEDEKIMSPQVGHEVFSPSVAIDGNGFVHLAATDVASGTGGPSLVAAVLTSVNLGKAAGSALKARYVQQATAVFDDGKPGSTAKWYGSTGAAVDPTSPWDSWVTGAIGSSTASNPNLQTAIARISMARNVVTTSASSTRVRKGSKVTITAKVQRPQSKDTIRGLPVQVQRRPAGGGSWSTVAKGSTSASGTFSARVKVTKTSAYRGVARKVQQSGGQGVAYDRVNGKPVTVRVR